MFLTDSLFSKKVALNPVFLVLLLYKKKQTLDSAKLSKPLPLLQSMLVGGGSFLSCQNNC